MQKRMVLFLLVLSMILGVASGVYASEAPTEEKLPYAELIFERKPVTTNINNYFFSEKDDRKSVIVNGVEALRMRTAGGCYYLMIDLDNEAFPKSTKEQSVAVTVEYYDEGYGHFTLRYDSVKNSVANVCEDHVDVIKMQDSRQWKKHTFYVDDAAFGGTLNNSDFIIALWSTRTGSISPEDLVIRSVKVERCMPQKPVIINMKSDEYGNIFSREDKKQMYFHFDNITDITIAADLSYTVLDAENNVYETGKFQKEIVPDDDNQIYTFESNVSKYGLYTVVLTGTLTYTFDGEEYVKEVGNSLKFSVVNKFTLEEERNPDFGVCTHMGQTSARVPEITAKIAGEAGIGILRDEERWNDVERQKGVYDFSGRFEFPHEIKKNGSDMLFIAAFGNVNYESAINANGWADSGGMPNNKEDMEAFGRYILKAIEESDGAIKYVEIWNEPNLYSVFNPLERGPEVYAEVLKVCYPMIKEKYPDIKVIGGSSAGLGLDYLEGIFEAGGYDYLDGVSVHPYDWGGSFRINNYINSMNSLRELMCRYGEMKEMWVTEMGWATSTVSEHHQAIYMVQLFAVSQATNSADKIIMYEFQDSGTDALDQEHNFGMVNYWDNFSTVMNTLFTGGAGKDVKFKDVSTPWAAKPSYLSLTAMNKIIGTAEYTETIDINSNIRAYRFKRKDGQSAVVLWADGTPQNVALKVDSNEVEILDMFSNSLGVVRTDDGTFNITVQKEPAYIVGDFSQVTLSESYVKTSSPETIWAKGDTLNFSFQDAKQRDLRIEIEGANGFKVVENNGIKVGIGNIKVLGTPNDNIMNYQLQFKLYDGDQLCHTETKNVQFSEQVSVKLDKSQVENSLDRWTADVEVTNNSSIYAYSGTVKITAPEEIAVYANESSFSNLQPGQSIVLPINMPRTVRQRMTDMEVTVTLDHGEVIVMQEKLSYADVKYTNSKPKIDGLLSPSEWQGTWVSVDRKEYIGKTGFRAWAGDADCSFSYNLMWDEENLYGCIVAKDDIFFQNYSGYDMWQGDSIQIGLTEGNPKQLIDTSYNELGFALTPAGSEIYRYSSYNNQPGGTISNSQIEITKKQGEVIYEFALPWKEAMSETYVPTLGNELSFSILFNDNDGSGRRGWLEYTDGIGATKNASLFDGVHLIP